MTVILPQLEKSSFATLFLRRPSSLDETSRVCFSLLLTFPKDCIEASESEGRERLEAIEDTDNFESLSKEDSDKLECLLELSNFGTSRFYKLSLVGKFSPNYTGNLVGESTSSISILSSLVSLVFSSLVSLVFSFRSFLFGTLSLTLSKPDHFFCFGDKK